MMFDNLPRPSGRTESYAGTRRRSRVGKSAGEPSGRRSSSFERASRLPDEKRIPSDRNTMAWLWVLGILMAAVLCFSWFLQRQKDAPEVVYGDAPSVLLSACIDPVLAPLTTGVSACSAETLADFGARFSADRAKTNRDSQDIYATASTIADILREAAEDRERHLARLQGLGSSDARTKREDSVNMAKLSETERQHLQLAVDVSWQRNSGAYRNRVEELWGRLLRLERGRFQSLLPTQPHS